jgi:hypothetical protein
VEEDLERASVRSRGEETVQEPFTTAELLEVIEHRGEHPEPVMPWDGSGPLTVDHYTTEELQEIADFERAHPLEGGRQ